MTEHLSALRAASVPDRPSLDGLEDKWAAVWQEQGTYAFDREAALAGPARGRLLHRHPAADGVRVAAHGPRVQLHAHRLHRALQADGGLQRLLPDRLGRQRPAHREAGAELLRRARRRLAAPRPRLRAALPRRRQEHQGRRRGADLAAELHRALRRADRQGRGGLRVALPPDRAQLRLVDLVPHHRRALAGHGAAGVPAQPRPRRGLPGRGARPVGRHVPDRRRPGRARGPRLPRALPPRRVPPPERRPVHIETTRPELIPSCVALIAHPDDERYQPLFGTTVTTPLFGVEVPVLAHPAAEIDKGAGIAMCCTFGDLTDVMWWRELRLPTRSVITRSGRLQARDARVARRRPRRGAVCRRARRQDRVRRPRGRRRRRCASRGDLDGEPTPTQRKANFYERGEKPLEIVTSRQWYIRNGGRDADLNATLVARGEEIDFHPAVHALALRELGRGPQRRLAGLAAALLRRADPGLVPASTPTASPTTTARSCRPRPTCPSTPPPTRPPATPSPSAASPVASSATPTSSTPGPRRR